MDTDALDRLERLFRAAQMHPPAERAAFLDATCADDPRLRAELDSLLAADDEADADAFLNAPAAALPGEFAGVLPDVSGEATEHRQIGPYRVLRRLGQGGMGDVYLAVRERPFQRQVALKVIRPGMDTREVLTRFEMERQILASLNHPGIAQLLDGGMTPDGRPYFAMEYVEGRPITDYCDERRMAVGERLRLFRDVCRAVQYAHQNLVIHRDLKPSNILVTEEGGVPHVKLLDFGIAKLLNPNLTRMAVPVTREAHRVMTPEYASPEQVRGEPLTTASDVYSLGVVLYELMTGRRPYRLTRGTTDEIARAVCEQDPERPSTRVTRAEPNAEGAPPPRTPATISQARASTVERLRRRLRGDLDNIVLMALRKESNRRYASAEQLVRDLERFEDGLPVEARSSTVGYRLRKFAGRHRVVVTAGLVVTLAILGGLGAALWQADAARQERDRAQLAAQQAEQARMESEAVTDFLMGLFEANDPREARGEDLTARQLLERGRARAEQLSDQAAIQAQMLGVIGQVYQSLGQYDKAQPLLEQALALRQAETGVQDLKVAESLSQLGFVLYLKGDYTAAEPYWQEALAVRRRHLGSEHLDVAESLTLLGALHRRRGHYEAAEPLYREALAMRRKLLGDDHADVATSLNNLALLLRLKGDYEGAETLLNEALSQWRRLLGEEHPYVAAGLNSLGGVYYQKGDYATAERLYRRSLAMRRRILGDEHPDVARSMTNLATVLRRTENHEEAEALYRQSLFMQRKLLGAHPDLAETLNNLALLLHRQKHYEEAETLYREALGMQREFLGTEHPDVAATMNNLALLMHETGAVEQAEVLYREVLALRRRLLGDEHPDVARSFIHVAALLRQQGEFEQAEALYQEALAIFRQQFEEGSLWIQAIYKGLAKLYDAWGRPDEAARYRALLPADPIMHADSTG